MSLQKISYSSSLKVRIRDTGHVMNENLWYQVLWTYSSFISMNSTSQNCVMCIMHYGLLHALVECTESRLQKIKNLINIRRRWMVIYYDKHRFNAHQFEVKFVEY